MFKIIGYIILGIIVLIILAVALMFWLDRKEREVEDKVKITVEYNPDKCLKDIAPLLVTFENTSDRTVEYISYDISIYRKGYSSDISENSHYWTDKIMKPNDVYWECAPIRLENTYNYYQNKPEELEFKISYKSVRFSKGK